VLAVDTNVLDMARDPYSLGWCFAAIAPIGEGQGCCERHFGKDVCCEVERRGALAA